MGTHRLPGGKSVIEGLSAISRALGYHVVEEFPIQSSATAPEQPVDVAWFFDDAEQMYPLMVFEIETRAGNTIANNPLKVFAQDNRVFQKPLFFFHIIVEGDSEISRINQLERQYGTYNYRLYRFALSERTTLLRDILGQHRRLSCSIDYNKLHAALSVFEVTKEDRFEVLVHARDVGLSPDAFLAAAIRLARHDDAFLPHLRPLIEAEERDGWPTIGLLPTWWATWGPMIACAWLAGQATAPEDAEAWDDRLMTWQDHNAFMPMFCAAIELSRDYTDFLLRLGGPFVAFIAGLMRGRGKAPIALCEVLVDTLRRIPQSWDSRQLATWTMHLAARLDLPEAYRLGERSIGGSRGISRRDLLTPPSVAAGLDSGATDDWEELDGSGIPTISTFRRLARGLHSEGCDRTAMMLALLNDPSYHLSWNRNVLASLWQSDSD